MHHFSPSLSAVHNTAVWLLALIQFHFILMSNTQKFSMLCKNYVLLNPHDHVVCKYIKFIFS